MGGGAGTVPAFATDPSDRLAGGCDLCLATLDVHRGALHAHSRTFPLPHCTAANQNRTYASGGSPPICGARLQHTELRTGVLIFVSVAERYAEIVADAGIATKVSPSVWDEAVAGLTSKI